MKTRPTPLQKQNDAVFTILDGHGNEIAAPVPTTSGQKHAARLRAQNRPGG